MPSSLHGKLALLTGSTGVIGKEIARGLLKHNYTVILPVRDQARGQSLKDSITDASNSSRVILEQVDLASKSSIQALCSRLIANYPQLDVLVNNAAIVPPSTREVSKDGYELQFAVNVLAYVWLTKGLHPLLKASTAASPDHEQARVVNVASRYAGGLQMSDLEFKKRRYESNSAYMQCKQANRMLSWYESRLYQNDFTVNAVYPGFTHSNVVAGLGSFSPSDTPEQSAATPVFAAVDSSLKNVTGKWIVSKRIEECQWARDVSEQEKLWKYCEQC